MTGYKTPAQRLEAAHTRIDKLTDEVATLSRVLAAQNQATASIQREWRMWSDALLRGGDAIKAIDPPDEYEAEHQALIRFFDDQYANAVAITQANEERDEARIDELFIAAGIVVEAARDEMSPEYRKIAAPWVDPDSTS